MRVGVKYCGNCNPRVDWVALLRQLGQTHSGWQFVSHSCRNYELLLVLSACPAACTSIPEFAGPLITASSETVNGQTVSKHELAAALAAQIRRSFEL